MLLWGEGVFSPTGISVFNRSTDKEFSEPQVIVDRKFHSLPPLIADLDGDGFHDLVTGGSWWFQNDAGRGFVEREQIPELYPKGYAASDVDADGDDDLIALTYTELKLVINDNLHFRTSKIADGSFVGAMFLDVDGDQDDDVVAVHEDGRLVWFEKSNGQVMFLPNEFQLETDHFEVLRRDSLLFLSGDIDGDGDDDLILGGSHVGYWYENADGLGSFVRRDELDMRVGFGAMGRLGDIDGDGDLDMIVTGRDRIEWLENQDGSGQFSAKKNLTPNWDEAGRRVMSLVIEDVDLDRDMDLLIGTYEGSVLWLENRLLGDADDDGEVSFRDFLVLSSSFGKEIDAIWEDGDFDANGVVDFSDFLLLSENFGVRR